MPKHGDSEKTLFVWDLKGFLLTGRANLTLSAKSNDVVVKNSEKKIASDIDRWNQHQNTKKLISVKLAEEIKRSVDSKTLENTQSPADPKVILTMAEQKRPSDDLAVAEAIQSTKRTIREMQLPDDPKGLIRLPESIVYTDAKPMSSLRLINNVSSQQHMQTKKRTIEMLNTQEESVQTSGAKKQLTLSSFKAVGIETLDDLLDENSKYWNRKNTTGKSSDIRMFRRDFVSSRHIAKVLFEKFGTRQTPCANSITGSCRVQKEPGLRHPCKPDAVCMRYLSPVQWEAFENEEEVLPTASPGDRFFLDPLCVFCTRYQLTREVSKDSVDSNSAINTELANYYCQVGTIGEYDKSACIQSINGNLSGIMGPIVAYNVHNFRPTVGLLRPNTWDMERTITVEEYQKDPSQYDPQCVVFGWVETGVFFQLNNNALPTATQINPYDVRITRVKDGPLTARLVLRGYFRQRTTSENADGRRNFAYEHLFLDLRETLTSSVFWAKPYPIFEPDNLKLLEEKRQVLDEDEKDPWLRYHPWQYVCVHEVHNAPGPENHRIYYTFLYLINGLLYVQEMNPALPEFIRRKLKTYIKSFGPLQNYFRETEDLTDAALLTSRRFCEALGAETSAFFAVYPRVAKANINVSDYEYVTLETVVISRAKPDEELRMLYFQKEIIPPHDFTLIEKARGYADLFVPLMRAQVGAYQAATDLFNKLQFDLRETTQFKWPGNTLSSFSPVVGPDADADHTEMLRRAAVTSYARNLTTNMETIYRELIFLLELENEQYISLVQNLDLATMEFGDTVKWVKEMISFHGDASVIFDRLGVANLNHLLPAGFSTNGYGVGPCQWRDNVYLLSALLRVFILDRLRTLEHSSETRKRHLLLLLRNSHCDLIAMVCERGPLISIRDDKWLVSRAVMPSDTSPMEGVEEYKPVISQLAAVWPIASREVHEGNLPNMGNSMLYVNFFSELDGKELFPLQRLFKHRNNLRSCAYTNFQKIFSNDLSFLSARKLNKLKVKGKFKLKEMVNFQKEFEKDIANRNFIVLLLELSLKGLYEHCDVAPDMRTTIELTGILRNADHPSVRELLDTLFSTTAQKGEERLKFDKIINDVIMEFIAKQLGGNTAVRDVLAETYNYDLTCKSLAMMDVVRIVLTREHSVDLLKIFTLQQRLSLKASQKIANRQKVGNIQSICKVVLASDETRYDSVYQKRATIRVEYQITPDQQWMIECFILCLDPTGNLYAEELEYIGLTEETIRGLSKIEDLQNGRDDTNDEAVEIFNHMEIHQSSLVAYFFEYLQRYIRYRPMFISNLDFIEKQHRALRKISDKETMEELPASLYSGIVSICCGMWNGFPPAKQFVRKTIDDARRKHYHTTLGNQSIRKDPISGEILCGFQFNKPTKKKTSEYFRKLQRNVEAEAGLVPADIDKEFITIRREYLANQHKANVTEIPRLSKQRKLEGRIPDCVRTRVMRMNLLNIILLCPPMKIPKQKKKDAQKKSTEEKKTQNRNRLYPPMKASVLTVSKPPYVIAPCCGRIHGYRLNNWGPNGYFCGGCLPDSNNEKSIECELLCASCLSIVPNRPSFNRCPDKKCQGHKMKKRNKCKHGAQPILLIDDVYTQKLGYQFLCDDCLLPFRMFPTELLTLSSIKARNPSISNSILLEQ